MGPDAKHGTHVAGIIGAVRNNGIGIDGIAPSVKVMMVRAVPDGDERDKDIANAIRYAVDNGAQVINMSFGKAFSPQKAAVDSAVRYADAMACLMVHAAGNDAENSDVNRASRRRTIWAAGGRRTGSRSARRRGSRVRRSRAVLELWPHARRRLRAGRGHPVDGARRL